MSRIFFSYRRAESPSAVGRIYDRLTGEFGVDSIFYDVETIPIGSDFPAFLCEEVAKCSMMVVVIGKEWIARIPQLHNNDDFVRIEIAAAIERRIPILPLLLDTEMPAIQLLPACLHRLPSMNGKRVDIGQDFHHHMNKVVSAIRVNLSEAGSDGAQSSISTDTSVGNHVLQVIDLIEGYLIDPGKIAGLAIGFPSIDGITSGLPDGETMVLASSDGKEVSVLAQNIIQNIAIDQQKPVFWVSTRELELARVTRMLRSRSQISDAEIKSGFLNRKQQESLAKASREIQKAPIQLFSAFSATVGEILTRLNALSSDQTSVIVIDDLLCLDGFDSPGMFRKLVLAARRRQIPIICVVRVNRRPKDAGENCLDAIDTGVEILNEAAITATISIPHQRRTYYDDEENDPLATEPAIVRIIKNDMGGLGDAHLEYNRRLGVFSEIGPAEEP